MFELFTLNGGTDGSGEFQMNWTTIFRNNTDEARDLSLFQFLDLDLGDAPQDEATVGNGIVKDMSTER